MLLSVLSRKKMVILPNKDVFQNPIENYSILGKERFDLEVGVSYSDNWRKLHNWQ